MANQAVLEKVLADEEFVKGLAEMETPEEVRDALNAKGADITVEEVQQIAKSLAAQAEGELDGDALEDVAGGTLWNLPTTTCFPTLPPMFGPTINRRGGRRW